MTYGQSGVVCPQCGSAAAVHSIGEWAAMAQGQPGGERPGYGQPPQPGYGPASQPGYQAGPGPSQYQQPGFPDPSQSQQPGFPDPPQSQQSGFPDPSQYQQSGFPDPSQYHQPAHEADVPQDEPSPDQPPASPAQPWPGQQPGYQAGPGPGQRPGYQPGPWAGQPPPRRSSGWQGIGSDAWAADDIADAVLGTATRFLGGAIGRRMRRTVEERVLPAMAARQEAMTRGRMAIAERHPDLCACLNDQVVFLAGGTRVLPLASVAGVRTVEQSDALVAQLRG
jgi:hypothetical protein